MLAITPPLASDVIGRCSEPIELAGRWRLSQFVELPNQPLPARRAGGPGAPPTAQSLKWVARCGAPRGATHLVVAARRAAQDVVLPAPTRGSGLAFLLTPVQQARSEQSSPVQVSHAGHIGGRRSLLLMSPSRAWRIAARRSNSQRRLAHFHCLPDSTCVVPSEPTNNERGRVTGSPCRRQPGSEAHGSAGTGTVQQQTTGGWAARAAAAPARRSPPAHLSLANSLGAAHWSMQCQKSAIKRVEGRGMQKVG